MNARFFVPLGTALALMVAGCGGVDSTDELSTDAIESRLESPADHYTMDDELVPADLQAEFGALDEATITQLDNELADLDLLENDDVLAETAAPVDANAAGDPADKTLPPRPDCPHGFIGGQWKHVAKGFGVFRAAFVNERGDLLGWVKGVYGRNKAVGKVILRDGKAHALLVGVYGGGHLRARLINRDGQMGALRGRYGNHVLRGKWVRFCQPRPIVCPAGLVAHPSGLFCVPAGCKPGSCGQSAFCDLCPPVCRDFVLPPQSSTQPPVCGTSADLVCPQGLRCERLAPDAAAPGRCVRDNVCVAVCGQPVCRPRPQPLPKPASCVSTDLGDATSCKPEALWRKYADGICTSKLRIVGAFGVAEPCGSGLFRRAKLACCERPAASTTPASN